MSIADVTLTSIDQSAEPTSASLDQLIEAHMNESDGTGFLKALIQRWETILRFQSPSKV